MSAPGRPVLIFDGVCNICSFGVRVVLRHDRAGVFDFAFAQGPVGGALKRRHGLSPSLDTVTVVDGDTVHVKSDAALYVAERLPYPWRLLHILRVLPRSWRDRLYDIVARNRYRWFGKRAACLAPPPEAAARFLDKP
jgi:predicted DCC family thiol-disulfide oxidoreductase YuxK